MKTEWVISTDPKGLVNWAEEAQVYSLSELKMVKKPLGLMNVQELARYGYKQLYEVPPKKTYLELCAGEIVCVKKGQAGFYRIEKISPKRAVILAKELNLQGQDMGKEVVKLITSYKISSYERRSVEFIVLSQQNLAKIVILNNRCTELAKWQKAQADNK